MKERSFEVGVGWIFYNLMCCKWVNNVVQFLMNMLNGWNWLFNVASISLLPPCQFANWKRKNPIKLLGSLKKSMEKLGWFAIKGSRLFF